MKRNLLLMVALLFMSIGLATAQTLTVTGTVVSESDGQPVAGAYVLVNGTTLGTITDAEGRFGIREVPADAKEIIVTFLGMSTASAPVQAEPLKIVMHEDVTYLEETIVTAMGISRSEKAIGYAATKVDGDEIAASRNANALDALQGKVAGLQIQATSSDPGSANSVTIRGFSSINSSNQPLYVVDGVPLQNSTLTSQGHSISTAGIANIAPDDIASMTILKGAAATALYGSRASNGVIVITTKTGTKEDGRNFTLSYNGGMQIRQVSLLPEMQNKWGQGWNGAQTFIENGSWGPAFDGSLQVYGPIWNNSQKYHTYDSKVKNVREFFDLGISHNHNVSLSGVSKDRSMTYYLSYSHTSDNGIMPTDKDAYKRNTISMRNTYDAAKWLKVSSSFNFANSATDIVGSYQGTSVIDGLLEMPRDMSIVDLKDLSDPFNTPEAYLTPYGITNPYWAMENNYNHTNSKQMFGKIQADFKPWEFLTFTYRFGFDYMDYDYKSGTPQIELDDALINEDYGYAPSEMNANGSVYNRYYRSVDLNHDFMANFSKTFAEKLDVNVVAGVNVWERSYTYMDGATEDLTFHTGFWDLSNGSTKSTLAETQMKRRLIGLFGDVTIGWDNMLFLNLTARNDWSSTLPIGNNNYFYPGATLSWVFTELFPNDVLTFGKARLAYGKTGNDAGAYMTSANFVQGYANGYYQSDIIAFPMNGTNAFLSSSTIGSSSLRPEMTSEFEVGLNLQFFDGRIGLDAAYYNRTTSDQIFTLPVDPATGYSSMVTNFGQVRNRGVELLLSTTPVHTRNFRWDLDVNFALNRNKVLTMPESLEGGKVTINGFSAGDDAVYMYAEVGKPLGTLYTYLPQTVTDEKSPYFGAAIVDAHGQPVLGEEVEFTGLDVNHKWTGGVTTSFSFYGVTLSATLDARVGGTMFSRTKNLMQFTGNSVITAYNDRRPFIIPNSVVDAGDGTYVPNTVPIQQTDGSYQDYFNLYGWGNGGTAYLLDRSFAKLRNVSVTWDLPKKWLSKAHIAGLSVSAFVNNAFVWTASDNYYVDPETTTEGTDLGGAFGELYTNPSCRIYGFNLNVKF
ncbi:MAG: SusC/RagA family TonB-linked outer membrane protein [Bacteroidales bacterium]|nr:SusC/RagA family TonB-linked outer membrane protein [Bacteroidales bacterium]